MTAWIGIGASLLVLFRPRARPRPERTKRRPASDQVLDLARMLALCLSAGAPLSLALAEVRRESPAEMRCEIDRLLRSAHVSGLAEALVGATGELEPLATLLARAQITGASMSAAVTEFVRARRAAARHRALEAARVLPVRLIVPIALFLLPGFIALVVGPTIVEELGGFAGMVLGR